MLAAVVEWSQIFEVIWVSLIAGVLVVALFSVVIHGSSRAAEARRTGSGTPAVHGAVAILAFTAFAAIVVFAITVILQKS